MPSKGTKILSRGKIKKFYKGGGLEVWVPSPFHQMETVRGDTRVGKVGAALVPRGMGIRAAFLSLKNLAGTVRLPLQNPSPVLF